MTGVMKFVESRREIEKILSLERLGYLGMAQGDLPYAIPLTYAYHEGRIIFHCAPSGKKLDFIKANPRVCFTVARQYGKFVAHPQGAACHAHSDSVVCQGTARVIEDSAEKYRAINIFNRCLEPEAPEIKPDEADRCNIVEIRIAEMTGREERDSQCKYWKFSFT
jgi:nitroimidazol reductase NimA-like FMN-containing flavoprotein (pyridoxamine 5'-phosphate oxidase superfamily)